MTAALRVGWALLVAGSAAGFVVYLTGADYWRAFGMGCAVVLLLELRGTLTGGETR